MIDKINMKYLLVLLNIIPNNVAISTQQTLNTSAIQNNNNTKHAEIRNSLHFILNTLIKTTELQTTDKNLQGFNIFDNFSSNMYKYIKSLVDSRQIDNYNSIEYIWKEIINENSKSLLIINYKHIK